MSQLAGTQNVDEKIYKENGEYNGTAFKAASKRKRITVRGLKNIGNVLLFTLPAMLPMVLFWIYPIINTGWLSFTDWDYMTPEYNLVGIENYQNIFTDSRFWEAMTHTILFAVGTVIPILMFGLILALLMRNKFRGSAVYKFLIFSPWITPTVAISIIWNWIFLPNGGLANQVLKILNLPASQWTQSSDSALMSVIIVTVWKSIGYAMIFYITALEKIPQERIEAASLDGANKLQKFRYIIFPGISPTTFFLSVVTMVDSLKAYDQIQILTQGGPSGSTRTLTYLYYQLGFEEFNMGAASAVAIVLIMITVTLSLIQFKVSKKWVNY